MRLFLISAADSCATEVKKLVEEHFEDRNIALDERSSPLWIVAAPENKTAGDVCDAIGMGDSTSGIVVEIGEYNGYEPKTLWQRLQVWLDEAG